MKSVSTLQQTHKTLKLQAVLSKTLFFITATIAIATIGVEGLGQSMPTTVWKALALVSFGCVMWYITTHVRIWWHHH